MSAGTATLLMRTRAEKTVEGSTVTDVYQVFTTSNSDTANDVLAAPGLPFLYSASDFDPLSVVIAIRPLRQEDSTTHWLVEVDYGRQKASDQDNQNPPTLRPVKRSASIRWVTKALQKDVTGTPILTSAQSPFNPPIEVQVPHFVLRFERWEEEFTTNIIKSFVGKTNSDTWGPAEPGEALCTNIEASEQWEQDGDGNVQRYWQLLYEFEVIPGGGDTWRPFKILDADYWMLTSGGARVPIYVDSLGHYTGNAENATPAPTPIPLASPSDSIPGRALQANELPDAAHYLEFNIYEETDFNALNLPLY